MPEQIILEEKTSNTQSNAVDSVAINEITPSLLVIQTVVNEQVEANLEKGLIPNASELNKSSSEQTIPQHIRKLYGGDGSCFGIFCLMILIIISLFIIGYNLYRSINAIVSLSHNEESTPGRITNIVWFSVLLPLVCCAKISAKASSTVASVFIALYMIASLIITILNLTGKLDKSM
ncbi:9749_t:CDS:1 [Dentiscutata heterogama]|uniref:9749_t:CDS:1 n=1 Tax=Dentiscutata heterogama TaxID=1316150 RepID=A0ACA9MWC0_9GLOM|nr:9749_t:CDS:1 [Dentiscutata heterogama]